MKLKTKEIKGIELRNKKKGTIFEKLCHVYEGKGEIRTKTNEEGKTY